MSGGRTSLVRIWRAHLTIVLQVLECSNMFEHLKTFKHVQTSECRLTEGDGKSKFSNKTLDLKRMDAK